MPNIVAADCGFNPQSINKPYVATLAELQDNFNICPFGVIICDVTGQTGPFDPVDLVNFQDGMDYKILLKGAASEKELLTFSDDFIVSSFVENISILDGEVIMYKLIKIGEKVYVDAVGYPA